MSASSRLFGRLLGLALALLVVSLAGCGGKGGSVGTFAKPSGAPAKNPPPPHMTATGPVAVPVRQTAGVVKVKVRSQLPLSGGPSLTLRTPSSISTTAPTSRRVSDTGTLLTRQGSGYDAALPQSNVSPNFASGVYAPNWTPAAPNKLAFATYRFNANGYTGLPTVGVAWTDGPADYSTYYIAVANWQANYWDWYEGPIDNVVSLASLAPYKKANGDVVVLIVLAGTKSCTLGSLSLGAEETRGTGNTGLFGSPTGGGSTSPPIFGGTLPSKVDHAPECAPIRNQGQLGSCTAFALCDSALNYEMHRVYGDKGWDFGNEGEKLSPRYLYVETGKDQSAPCDATGRYYDQVVSWLKAHGTALEQNAPYLPTPCDDNWSQAALGDAAVVRPVRGEAVPCTTDAGITQVKTLLAQGRVVPVGTLLDDAFMNYTAGSPPWSFTGPQNGGHAMCIVGYDDAKQAFKVRNSWGEEWGDNGFVWIAYDSLKNPAAGAMCFVVELEYSQAVADRFLGGGGTTFAPPTGVTASDGDFTDKIHISWNAVSGATGYKLFRDVQDIPLQALGNVTSFDDPLAADGYSHTYWVKALKPGQESSLSASDTGFSAGGNDPPVIFGVYFTQGNVGDNTQFYVDYYSSTPASFAWTLGGCNPGTSTDEAPAATFATAGTHTVSITVTNGGGSANLSGDIYIGGGGAPTAMLDANPDTGTAPLPVTLDASGSSDDVGIYELDWDWEGDGTFDYTSGLYSIISVDFPAGDWNTTVRVWDWEGNFDDASVAIHVDGQSQGSYTEFEPNDDFFTPSPINAGTGDIGSCGSGAGYPGYDGDFDDIWGISVTGGGVNFQPTLQLDSGTGDLDLYIYDSVGTLGAWSEGQGDTETFQVFLPDGIYYLRVYGSAGYSDYALSYATF